MLSRNRWWNTVSNLFYNWTQIVLSRSFMRNGDEQSKGPSRRWGPNHFSLTGYLSARSSFFSIKSIVFQSASYDLEAKLNSFSCFRILFQTKKRIPWLIGSRTWANKILFQYLHADGICKIRGRCLRNCLLGSAAE